MEHSRPMKFRYTSKVPFTEDFATYSFGHIHVHRENKISELTPFLVFEGDRYT